MKKTGLYLLLVVALGALAYYALFKKDDSSFEQSEANFTVKDTSKIEKIALSDLQNHQVILERKHGNWILNDNDMPDADMMNLLLIALKKQIPEEPVPLNYHDKVVSDLSGNHTKVEVFSNGEKTHVFYVGKDPSPKNLTYMLTEKAKRPFIVRFPFEDAFLGLRYNTDFDTWRSKRIMYKNTPIELVDIAYKDSTQYSFKVNMQTTDTTLIGNYSIAKPLNTKRTRSFIKMLNELNCVGFENNNFEKDAILSNGKQMGTVSVKRKGFDEDVLTIYFRPIDKGSKGAIILDGIEYDVDYFYGILNKKDMIVLSSDNVKKMMRMYPEFYEEEIAAN